MWRFNRRSNNFDAQAKAAAPILIACCEETAPTFLKALVGENNLDSNKELITPLTIELLVFGLHLADRITFGRLGARGRSAFMNALLSRVRDELKSPLNSQLQDLYNTRNAFYAGFQKLTPDDKDNLKGTLFWEFGKAMGSVYAGSNPVAIMEASMQGMSLLNTINRVLATVKVV
jgi:hypothetical protein